MYVFQQCKVWEKKLVEKDGSKLTRKRKVSGHYEKKESPVKISMWSWSMIPPIFLSSNWNGF